MNKVFDIVNYSKKIIRKDEIKKFEIASYHYETTNKITVKIPLKFIDKLALAMSKAGAGIVGNYEMCSFRLNGTGTFKPSSISNPFIGNKDKINFVEEVKMEMRCEDDKIDNVVGAIYKNHPYEEPDYDIQQIKFRSKKAESVIIMLKKSITAEDLFKRINKNIKSFKGNKKVSKLLFTTSSKQNNSKADAVIIADEFIKLKLK
ncbi:MAG: hypothetical protein JSS63_09025 [Bacteroidetes bacterium]|nr:hypothetical protein [Bacteroidota bacterium]MBX7045778.1 hypothetical protein [Ignavibacteria bacterium]